MIAFIPRSEIAWLTICVVRIFWVALKITLVIALTRDYIPVDFVYAGF